MKVYITQDNCPCHTMVWGSKPYRDRDCEIWREGRKLGEHLEKVFRRIVAENERLIDKYHPTWEDEPVELEIY